MASTSAQKLDLDPLGWPSEAFLTFVGVSICLYQWRLRALTLDKILDPSVVQSVPGSVTSSLKLGLQPEPQWGCAKTNVQNTWAEALYRRRASETPVHPSEHSGAWYPLPTSKRGPLGRCILAELNRPFWCVLERTNHWPKASAMHTHTLYFA